MLFMPNAESVIWILKQKWILSLSLWFLPDRNDTGYGHLYIQRSSSAYLGHNEWLFELLVSTIVLRLMIEGDLNNNPRCMWLKFTRYTTGMGLITNNDEREPIDK